MNTIAKNAKEIYADVQLARFDDIETIGKAVLSLAQLVGDLAIENENLKKEIEALQKHRHTF